MARGKKTGGRDFVKGGPQPANRGRKPLPPDLKAATELTKSNLKGLLNKYLWMSKPEMQAVIKDHNTPMIEIVIASIVFKAAVQGDEKRLDFILTRLIGRVKEEIDLTTYLERLNNMSDQEIIELSTEAVAFLKDGGSHGNQ